MNTKPILALASLLLCVSAAQASGSAVGEITDVVVEETGIGPAEAGCGAFSVSPAEVEAFFRRAVLLSGRHHHDYFLHGPCSARGTLEGRYGTWHWEIRNLGTGTLTAITGDVFLLGDPRGETSPEG